MHYFAVPYFITGGQYGEKSKKLFVVSQLKIDQQLQV